MRFRCATINDFQRIANVLSMKEISYITITHLFDDIMHKQCFVLEDGYEIKAIGSLVYCPEYSNYAIKRVCVLRPEDCGQGYARKLINFLVINRPCNMPLVCTPWLDNIAMQKILVGLHFQLEYVFDEKWCLYQLA